MMHTTTQEHDTMTATNPSSTAAKLASVTDDALASTQRLAERTSRSVQGSIDGLRETVPGAITRAAGQVDDLTRRSMDQARHAMHGVRERAVQVGDATKHRIQDEPVKAVLLAAATGAAAALLVQWMTSRRRSDRAA
jgi:ElaB/YqjD/DUF883 family membrane-anchored ribosome-binding protein